MIKEFSDSLIEECADFKIVDIILFDDIINIDLTSNLELDGDYPELTEEQKEATEYKITPYSAQIILDSLKKCETVHTNNYYKMLDFMKQYSLTAEDCLDIIKQLTVDDYYHSLKSRAQYHYGNNLIVFKPKNIKLKDGRVLNNLVIYIKIDLDLTTDEAVALVSFHEDKLER